MISLVSANVYTRQSEVLRKKLNLFWISVYTVEGGSYVDRTNGTVAQLMEAFLKNIVYHLRFGSALNTATANI